jgi:hypothetical protein
MTAQTILPANSVTGGFDVDNSVRLDGTSAYLKFTSSAGNRRTWTYSTWVKRSKLTNDKQNFISSYAAQNDAGYTGFRFQEGEVINLTGWSTDWFTTTRVFRDLSAWYHIVLAVDTTNATAGNRLRLYVNGVEETSFSQSNNPDENEDLAINVDGEVTYIASEAYTSGGSRWFNGYIAETVLIDGLQLTPSSFGEFDSDSGIWKPKDVSGLTRGTNGFYLDFKDSSNLGNDAFGDTDLTEVNLAATDQSTDTCTNNFCTLNPLTKRPAANGTITEGNLQYTASTGDSHIYGTMAIPPGMKVYFEVKLVSNTAQNAIGIHNVYDGGDGAFIKGGGEAGTYSFKPRGASSVTQYFNNGSATNHSIDNVANDTIIGVAVDNANGQIHYSIAGTYINSSDPTDNNPVALVTGFGGANEQYLHFSLDTTSTNPSNQFNFGSPPYSESGGESDADGHGNFNQAVPSGYFALCTKNLAEYG